MVNYLRFDFVYVTPKFEIETTGRLGSLPVPFVLARSASTKGTGRRAIPGYGWVAVADPRSKLKISRVAIRSGAPPAGRVQACSALGLSVPLRRLVLDDLEDVAFLFLPAGRRHQRSNR